ncbi:MAG: hypothetical protein QXD60_04660, partial [Nanopusillaceae archaeon]
MWSKPWFFKLILVLGLWQAAPAWANLVKQVTKEQAQQQGVVVEVASGYGVNISFLRLPERIVRVWVDDISELLVEFDRPFPDVKVIHLRRLQPSQPPLQTRSATHETLMTVVTQENIYKFFIRPVAGRGRHKTIEVVPGGTSSSVVQLERGLAEAIRQRRLEAGSALTSRIRELIALLRQGHDLDIATQRTGLKLATIKELMNLGQNRGTILERLRERK